jgi:hypothetical protein
MLVLSLEAVWQLLLLPPLKLEAVLWLQRGRHRHRHRHWQLRTQSST